MAYYIQNILLNQERTNILIEGNTIAAIGKQTPSVPDATIIDGSHLAAFPSFANMHTHAAMNLFRGFANDLPLMTWLNDWIWPKEKHLDYDIVYSGTKLACLEMIKSGTTLFSDMYFHIPAAAKAAAEMGIRCTLGITAFGDGLSVNEQVVEETLCELEPYKHLVNLAIAPHAIYTVSDEGLIHLARLAQKYGLLYHIHMSETQSEVDDCMSQRNCRPYELLQRLGVLDFTQGRFTGAHSLHLSDNEISILGSHHATVVHNPCSNLKLGSGHSFKYCELRDAGVNVTLGTDGCSSSNNLDMIDAAKFMSYLQKGIRQDPTILPAEEMLQVATSNGFHALGINAGSISVGAEADLMLVSTDNIAFIPNNNTLANLLYAAHGDCVDTVFCHGKMVMHHRKIDNEADIISQAKCAAQKLLRD